MILYLVLLCEEFGWEAIFYRNEENSLLYDDWYIVGRWYPRANYRHINQINTLSSFNYFWIIRRYFSTKILFSILVSAVLFHFYSYLELVFEKKKCCAKPLFFNLIKTWWKLNRIFWASSCFRFRVRQYFRIIK